MMARFESAVWRMLETLFGDFGVLFSGMNFSQLSGMTSGFAIDWYRYMVIKIKCWGSRCILRASRASICRDSWRKWAIGGVGWSMVLTI